MDLLESVAATYAVIGQEMNDLALRAIVAELAQYPADGVNVALSRCRKELRKLTLADILERIPGGHPKPEEAWAIVSRVMSDEQPSVVWTEQMAEAYGVACRLGNDMVAARMAFKETYTNAVNRDRSNQAQPTWRCSFGFDPSGRQSAVEEAVKRGFITAEHATRLLPNYSSSDAEETRSISRVAALA